jgi:hypothetical protein
MQQKNKPYLLFKLHKLISHVDDFFDTMLLKVPLIGERPLHLSDPLLDDFRLLRERRRRRRGRRDGNHKSTRKECDLKKKEGKKIRRGKKR